MKTFTLLAIALSLLTISTIAKDVEGSKDPEGFKRITNSEIIWTKTLPFNQLTVALEKVEFDYSTQNMKDSKKLAVEGPHEIIYYKVPGDTSTLEVIRQYQAHLQESGFETLFEAANDNLDNGYNRFVTYVFPEAMNTKGLRYLHEFNSREQRYAALKGKTKDGQDRYCTIYATKLIDSGTGYEKLRDAHQLEPGNVVVRVDVITPKSLSARMELVTAEKITTDIADTGKVIIYGVYFDTDKAVVKPDSEPTLLEMAKAIKDSPSNQKFLIVGHTDNQGSYDHNQDLSARRAKAVVEALIKNHQIDSKKIIPVGVGMAAPVSTNSSEEGRAKNRRVEIVAM